MPPKYRPGGRKFPPKVSSAPRNISSSTSAPSSSSNVLDPEVEDQFEIELYWCIQQLQTALDSGKMNERQTHETNKTLNVLKSSTAPLIKKRQFMRTTFGDYRAKMSNDEKKLGKNSAQVKFFDSTNAKTNYSAGSKKSIFLKKAAHPATTKTVDKSSVNTEPTSFRIVPTGNSFSFNFSEPEKS